MPGPKVAAAKAYLADQIELAFFDGPSNAHAVRARCIRLRQVAGPTSAGSSGWRSNDEDEAGRAHYPRFLGSSWQR